MQTGMEVASQCSPSYLHPESQQRCTGGSCLGYAQHWLSPGTFLSGGAEAPDSCLLGPRGAGPSSSAAGRAAGRHPRTWAPSIPRRLLGTRQPLEPGLTHPLLRQPFPASSQRGWAILEMIKTPQDKALSNLSEALPCTGVWIRVPSDLHHPTIPKLLTQFSRKLWRSITLGGSMGYGAPLFALLAGCFLCRGVSGFPSFLCQPPLLLVWTCHASPTANCTPRDTLRRISLQDPVPQMLQGRVS